MEHDFDITEKSSKKQTKTNKNVSFWNIFSETGLKILLMKKNLMRPMLVSIIMMIKVMVILSIQPSLMKMTPMKNYTENNVPTLKHLLAPKRRKIL